MEREIKFKAKKLSDGSWVEGSLVQYDDGHVCISTDGYVILEVDPSTVCQYTGERDMNGKDIYVGDILSNLETGSVVEIVWSDRLKRLDCKFLNGDKAGFNVPFGIFIQKYKHVVVLMSKFDKEV